MKPFIPYRFSPISSQDELLRAITHIHTSCFKLCFMSFSEYLSNNGNVGVFCHYDDEYAYLKRLQAELCEPCDDSNLKYIRLHEPITIPAQAEVPAATYTHLYIRRPDPYRAQVGDIDFFVEPDRYAGLKHGMQHGTVTLPHARLFDRPDLDMIELYHPDVDALAYLSTSRHD